MEIFPLGRAKKAHPQKTVVDAYQHPDYTRAQGQFYKWLNTTGKQPTPGAEAFAFSTIMLPLQDWKGPGEIVRKQLYLTAPQVYVNQMVIPTGIAGITAGQVALAELMDNPYDLSGGGT
jgi:hypothetical protein